MNMKQSFKRRLLAFMLIASLFASVLPPGGTYYVAAADSGDERVAQFVADNHVLMLRADGRLLGWGDNTHGQLGLGAEAPKQFNTPQEITFFADKAPIKQLAVIQDSSFILLTNGDLYAAGKGDNGRLGLNDTNPRAEWTLVNPDTPFNRLHINESAEFALAESFDGHIYTWGKNDKAQCGNNTTTNVFKPTKVVDAADVDTLWVGVDYVLYCNLSGDLVGWGNLSSTAAGLQVQYKQTTKTQTQDSGGNKTEQTTTESTKHIAMPNKLTPTNLNSGLYPIPATQSEPPPPPHTTYTVRVSYFYPSRTFYATLYNHSGTFTGEQVTVTASNNSTLSIRLRNNDENQYGVALDIIGYDNKANQTWNLYTEPVMKNTHLLKLSDSLNNLMTGSSHAVAYAGGKYYGWGAADKKQLGSLAASAEPVELAFVNDLITQRKLDNNVDLLGLDVVRNTTYMRWSDGKIHAYGDNAYNKAGIEGAPITIATPTQITTLQDKDIINVVSGRDTTYYIASDGKVYVSGSNLKGQAGLGADYDSSATINTPTENPNVKFSYTAEPPKPPTKVEVPNEAEAGNTVTVVWDEVPDAVSYELTRTVVYGSGEIVQQTTTEGDTEGVGSAATGNQVIYNGPETQYVDSISPDWESIAYAVRSLNYVGDYSSSIITDDITVKIPTSPGNDTTPPTVDIIPNATKKQVTIIAEDTGSGMEGIYINGLRVATNVHTYTLTLGETIAITAKDKAGNVSSTRIISYNDVVGGGGGTDTDPDNNGSGNGGGSGMSNEQLLALLAALGGNKGLSASELAALLASNKGMTAAELAALLNNNSSSDGLAAVDIARLLGLSEGSSGIDGLNPVLMALLAQQPSYGSSTGNSNDQLMAAMLQLVGSQQGSKDINFNITLPGELAAFLPQPAAQNKASAPVVVLLTVLSVVFLLMLILIPIYFIISGKKNHAVAAAPGKIGVEDLLHEHTVLTQEYNRLFDDNNAANDEIERLRSRLAAEQKQ